MDLISRKAAIEACRKYFDRIEGTGKFELLEDLRTNIPSEMKWIPIEEQEPGEGQVILALDFEDRYEVGGLDYALAKRILQNGKADGVDERLIRICKGVLERIVAWMPFPEYGGEP